MSAAGNPSGARARVSGQGETIRLRITVQGAVQGVGFRPFVFRLANEMGLRGWANNSAQGVFIEVEGPKAELDQFLIRLELERPPRSFIQSLESSWLDPANYTGFAIRESDPGGLKSALVLPDIAICSECLAEMFDPQNRRYYYPFTNCTNCGPRFSIIQSLPYDRANTSMNQFTMCSQCQAEYDDPRDRRFHAQPNACPVCGPQLELWDSEGVILSPSSGPEQTCRTDLMEQQQCRLSPGSTPYRSRGPLDLAAEAIRAGRIVAVKGLGGFHLMTAASDEQAVSKLRERKHREEKPLALMFPSLEAVRSVCELSRMEERLLLAPEAPIVLLRRLTCADSRMVALNVAPGNPNLGVMLPYTPLHHLLLLLVKSPVVATSGNLSDEPICIDEQEALQRLHGIADLFLVHNRPIVRHVDDSIVRVMAGRELVLRRARGYAPLPLRVRSAECGVRNEEKKTAANEATLRVRSAEPSKCGVRSAECGMGTAGKSAQGRGESEMSANTRAGVQQDDPTLSIPHSALRTPHSRGSALLAVGGHLKNTIALAIGPQVFISQHIGDLETEQAYGAFQRVIGDLQQLYDSPASRVVADAHPDYLSTRFSQTTGLPCTSVQHHVAHVLSCMAENELDPPVLGVAWDGTGYGLDGTVWGGEFFRVQDGGYERVAHLRQFRLPGGEQAVKEPRRSALGLLFALLGEPACERFAPARALAFTSTELTGLRRMLVRGVNSPLTSSVGRLFDAVASLTGLRQRAGFEGQAAMELEFLADNSVAQASALLYRRLPVGTGPQQGDVGIITAPSPESSGAYPMELRGDKPLVLDWGPGIEALLEDVNKAVPAPVISARFHHMLVEAIIKVAARIGLERVALSGGCFQNRYLAEHTIERLRQEGFRAYWHQRVPPNDGGICLGQVVAARWWKV